MFLPVMCVQVNVFVLLLFLVASQCTFYKRANIGVQGTTGVLKPDIQTVEDCKAECLKLTSCTSLDFGEELNKIECIIFNVFAEAPMLDYPSYVYLEKEYAVRKFVCR